MSNKCERVFVYWLCVCVLPAFHWRFQIAWIAEAMVTQRGAFVLSAGQKFTTDFVARWTLTIATLKIEEKMAIILGYRDEETSNNCSLLYINLFNHKYSVTYLSVTSMFITVLQTLALHLTCVWFRAWELLRMETASAFFLHYFQTLAAFALVTTFSANMITALKGLLACISAWTDLFGARGKYGLQKKNKKNHITF